MKAAAGESRGMWHLQTRDLVLVIPMLPPATVGSPISQIPRPQAAECRGSTQDVDGAGIRPPPWGAEPLAGGTGKPVPVWGMSPGNVPKPKRTKLGSRKNETIRQHGAGSGRW